MSAIIVGIHGLANKPPLDVLTEWWETSLREGLEKNEGKGDAEFRYEMVYWRDLLYMNPMHRKANFSFDKLYNSEPYIPARDGALKAHNDNWLDDIRDMAGSVSGSIIDLAHRHFGTDAIAKLVIDRVLRDLEFYYDEERQITDHAGQQRLARRVLMDELKDALLGLERNDEPIVLIAHSMGSIIAYDVLREIGREDPAFVVEHFITIGSPLGLPTVKANVHDTNKDRSKADHVRTPTVVRQNWINFADRADPVSFDSHLGDDYGANANGIKVRDDIVLNDYVGEDGERNHHKSYGYLRTPEMSGFLAPLV